MKQRNLYGLAGAFLLASSVSLAGSNSYVFVENQVDGEYFIAAESLNPRFTGANRFTKFASSRQESLGYMGDSLAPSISNNNYADIWLEDSPIDKPFLGNRCMNDSSGCPENGLLPAEYLGKNGAYRIFRGTANGQSNNARGIFSDAAYEYFKSVPVGKLEIYKYRWCSTTAYYNPAAGQTCLSTGARLGSDDFNITKLGHVRLESTNALQEIFIDSNGNPSLGSGSSLCSVGYVGSTNGIICKLVSYQLSGQTVSPMRINLQVDTAALGFTPRSSTIRMSPDGATGWVNYGDRTRVSDLIKPGNTGIYVFFSQVFLKELINRGVDLSHSKKFFTFLFTNTRTPQSGYYEFSPSNTILLIPRDYGLSIISKDLVLNPKREGNVGSKEPPIVFDYLVTTSGPRQADSITAQVYGPAGQVNGRPYCVFSSTDGKLRVPFSAYLAYTNDVGQMVRTRASCDDVPISLNAARWIRTAWPVPSQNDGSFYRTELSLSFPMNEGHSMWTMDGRDWMGIVSATGEVRVRAVWTGADIH
ncbi:fimbrial protein [Serratia silvae]|uniref:Fimbrial protein n=1 Tax=Serratia silvae TaxID=2824122 RepID=A0ABT0K670_9GAMM|nr:fimbrial protein [Serratia silvae]MCL1027507.1 fimbrial protein [Serratia silvae]